MRRLAAVSVVAAIPLVLAAISSYATEVTTITREGVVELAEGEVALLVTVATQDLRYSALQDLVEQRKLRLDPKKARGLSSKGRDAVFIPAFDVQGTDSGFLTYSKDSWTLSLSFGPADARVMEAFTAKIGADGKPTLEAFVMPKSADVSDHGHVSAQSTTSTSCIYVSRTGFNFACWSDENFFGYYYNVTYRWGTTPDPSSPSWWTCAWGYIHICPRYEAPGSPFIYPECGRPPLHSQGG